MKRYVLAALVAAGGLAVPLARANGDPASDYLLSQSTFIPFDAKLSQEETEQLNGVVAEAKKQGFTIRVALIASELDLGAVPCRAGASRCAMPSVPSTHCPSREKAVPRSRPGRRGPCSASRRRRACA